MMVNTDAAEDPQKLYLHLIDKGERLKEVMSLAEHHTLTWRENWA